MHGLSSFPAYTYTDADTDADTDSDDEQAPETRLVHVRARDEIDPRDGKTRSCDRARTFEMFVGGEMMCGSGGSSGGSGGGEECGVGSGRGRGRGRERFRGVFGSSWRRSRE